MAIYRFKISFEDYDEVQREIDIRSNQTFEDLHRALHRSTGYPEASSSSFFVSNDFWIKGEEIAFLPNSRKVERGVKLMESAKLSSFIDDPHQKFYYTYNFDRPFDFHVELIKIMLEEEGQKEYPCLFRSVGEAPKIPGSVVIPATAASATKVSDDFDFLNEMEFDPENLEEVDDLETLAGETSSPKTADEEQMEEGEDEDDYMDEFSDNENYDSEDYQKDDY
ncbi:MAG: IS1096 element passenger TnpR family protein [Sphingobacteriaceae bacterium]